MAISWAQRLKRVFNMGIETCPECGRAVKVTAPALPAPTAYRTSCTGACIEDPVVIRKILTHLDKKATLNRPD